MPYEVRKYQKFNLLLPKCSSNSDKMNILSFFFKFTLSFKRAPSGLRQFLATERSLKMMKNACYFTSKALFVLKIFKLLSRLFGHVSKRLDQNDKVNFKLYYVTAWLTNNCNTHITQYLEK